MLNKYIAAALLLVLSSCGGGNKKPVDSTNSQKDTTKVAVAKDTVSSNDPIYKPLNEDYSKQVIEVGNFAELYKNIGPNRTLKLKAGKEFIIPAKAPSEEINVYVKFERGITITGVENMKILGDGKEQVKITQPDPANCVFILNKCSNFIFDNINAGHYPKKGGCAAAVIATNNSKGLFINNSILYGSGYEGINAYNAEIISCQNTTIKECSTEIMALVNSKGIKFYECRFTNNTKPNGAGKIYVSGCQNVFYTKCGFTDNAAYIDKPTLDALFNTERITGSIMLKDCEIKNNKASGLGSHKDDLKLIDCKEEGNSWQKPS